jgi:hypothetical protein
MDIEFRGILTKDKLTQIFKLGFKHHRLISIILIIVLLFALSLTSFLTYATGFNPITVGVFVFVLIMTTYSFWAPYTSANSVYNDQSGMKGPISGSISEDTITIQTVNSKSIVRWNLFNKIKRAPDLILLYQNSNCFNFFPQSFFSDEDWLALNNFIDKKISEGTIIDLLRKPIILIGNRSISGLILWLFIAGFGIPAFCFLISLIITLMDLYSRTH